MPINHGMELPALKRHAPCKEQGPRRFRSAAHPQHSAALPQNAMILRVIDPMKDHALSTSRANESIASRTAPGSASALKR
jgi:hypothetical protein